MGTGLVENSIGGGFGHHQPAGPVFNWPNMINSIDGGFGHYESPDPVFAWPNITPPSVAQGLDLGFIMQVHNGSRTSADIPKQADHPDMMNSGSAPPAYQVMSYTRNNQVSLQNAVIKLPRGMLLPTNRSCLSVKVETDGAFGFLGFRRRDPDLEWSAAGKQIDVNYDKATDDLTLKLPKLSSNNKLPNEINMYDFRLKFWLSLDGGKGWISINDSPNKYTLFATYAKPDMGTRNAKEMELLGPTQFTRGLVQAGCIAAAGASPADTPAAVDDIFNAFRNRTFSICSGIAAGGGLKMANPGYWQSWSIQGVNLSELFDNNDGQCGQWAQVFTSMLRAQGIVPDNKNGIYHVTTKNGEALLIKGQWAELGDKMPTPVARGGFKYDWANERANGQSFLGMFSYNKNTKQNEFIQFNNQLMSNSLSGLLKPTGQPIGQNNPNPKPAFMDHAVVQWGDKVYDPSYGHVFPNRDAFVIDSIAEFALAANVTAKEVPQFATLADPKTGAIPVWLFRKPSTNDPGKTDLNWKHLNDLTAR